MGYNSFFSGKLQLSRPLTKKEKSYINNFSRSRRMKRDVNKLMELYKGKFGYPFATEKTAESIYGVDGEYFVPDDSNRGQEEDESIIDYGTPPGQFVPGTFNPEKLEEQNELRICEGSCQPGSWCQWVITEKGDELAWDEGEKFYNYIEWLSYLIAHFFERWDVKLNGIIYWEGEEPEDKGKIEVIESEVNAYFGIDIPPIPNNWFK